MPRDRKPDRKIELASGPARGSAVFSPCRRYRYLLSRVWNDSLPTAVFIGLNPSTADASRDDPTLRRCIGFSQAWGFGGLIMLNLFAFRATAPAAMKRRRDPVGPDNDSWLKQTASRHATVIACWGVHGRHKNRSAFVSSILPPCHCLAINADGEPAHPLYLRASLQPRPFTPQYTVS